MTTPYQPLYVRGMQTGLVQNRQQFILPDDAYPTLINMFIWREQLRRRQGLQFLGRLTRTYPVGTSLGNSGSSPWSFNIFSLLSITETNPQIIPGSVIINIDPIVSTGVITNYLNQPDCIVRSVNSLTSGAVVTITGVNVVPGSGPDTINGTWTTHTPVPLDFNLSVSSENWGVYASGGTWSSNSGATYQLIDQGNGLLATNPVSSVEGTINYLTGAVTITGATSGQPTTITFSYYPGLPVMGIRTQEVAAIDDENTIVFDTKYAYQILSGNITELPSATPTTWTGSDSNFFWSTNYWVNSSNSKLFWVTNFSGVNGDPIRYYDPGTGASGTETWVNFTPKINAANDLLTQSLAILPFRGRLLVFNTLEGQSLGTSVAYYQRVRWSAIGSPLITNAWRDDIRGQGGFLDIPTSENITAVGFVRDNLVIYCERSTWQLRYTGRSIAPFQIEKVNSELGAASTFSAVQFDTSLVGIGDKGIVECDSYKSDRIDIKIPDLVFKFSNSNSAPERIQGIRDIQQRVAYWNYVDSTASDQQIADGGTGVYPNRRLVYNYENDSWAIYTDSITAMGTYQPSYSLTWIQANYTWNNANFPWTSRPGLFPALIGGNQQGFLFYLGSNITPLVLNQQTLTITSITGNNTSATTIVSPNHNMVDGQVIQISGIPSNSPDFSNLNGGIFGVVLDKNGNGANQFNIYTYSSVTGQFDDDQEDSSLKTYPGVGGVISLIDNIDVVSKKFNFLDQGQNIQMGYIDLLTDATQSGAFTLNVYMNYNDNQPVNELPENSTQFNGITDPFFNTIVPTNQPTLGGITGTKYWQRVYCPVRAAFLTLEFTLSNAQLNGVEANSNIQIDSQILWLRNAGRLQSF